MSFKTTTARWRALSIRDPTANNHFVYTVKSTLVYCRPTCPARLARRANVGFCDTPAQAEAAGFRACKRCKPNVEVNEDPQGEIVAKACSLIEEAEKKEGGTKGLRLQDLAKSVGLTPRYFHKTFKDRTGLTPKEYMNAKQDWSSGENTGTLQDGTFDLEPFELEPFNLDAFDFNDLVNFDMDMSLVPEDPVALPMLQPLPGMFGSEIDMNIQMPALETLDPDCINVEFGKDDPVNWIDASGISGPAPMVNILDTTGTIKGFDMGMYGNVFV
jgi:methylphosphotriester-DNA--protein-cysteine methyltransferase